MIKEALWVGWDGMDGIGMVITGHRESKSTFSANKFEYFLPSFFIGGGQNANRTKCQPDIMPTKGWHFVRTFFCGWHFVRPNFWLTFCPEHLNMFWPFVRIMENVVMP